MRGLPLVLGLLTALAGCTAVGDGEDAGSAIAASTGSFGVIRVEREIGDIPDLSAPEAVLGAAFARYQGIEGQRVVGLLGVRSTPVEECTAAAIDDTSVYSADAEVELMEVGEVEVRVADTVTSLGPRTFPDIAGLVHGAFYAEDTTLGQTVADVDEYVVSAPGGEQVAGFDVMVLAPTGFTDVTIDGYDPSLVTTLSRHGGLTVGWDAGDPRDQVEIDVVAGGAVIECTGWDDGSFRVPEELLLTLASDRDARVVLRRVRTQRFDVEGVDAAWVSVANAQTIRAPLD